ncbi:MAG: glycerol kinase GlpK [Clostridia bacterium]|nr:glycerol kinase GlpK [Clostridia bacterium]
MRKFILGIDEGTTNLKCVLYDVEKQEISDIEQNTFKNFYPHPAWVEQNANEIFKLLLRTAKAVLKRNSVEKGELLGVGITNQRETVVAWDRRTGEPICNAIVWQCRRTSNMIEKLTQKQKDLIKEKTGLIANPYFSASKMKWILDNVPEAKTLAKSGNLCFGNINTYLAFKLAGSFATDTTNASRTMLMNLKTLEWDDELLKLFKIPKASLPEILPCDANVGSCKQLLNAPIVGMIGDQQSSMVGQGAIFSGDTKLTLGTGAFMLTNIGKDCTKKLPRLLTTVACTLGDKTDYAIEGSMYSACSALDWLKSGLGQYESVSETDKMANSLTDNEGVYLVPAFTGLGAPYWNDNARACIVGMTFATKKEHLVRACLESMVYNTKDIVDEMKKCKMKLKMFSVDGGGSKSEFTLQFMADMLNHEVVKSKQSQSTALGAIYIAMLSLKLIKKEDIKKLAAEEKKFFPNLKETERKKYYAGWKKAIGNCEI